MTKIYLILQLELFHNSPPGFDVHGSLVKLTLFLRDTIAPEKYSYHADSPNFPTDKILECAAIFTVIYSEKWIVS